MSQGPNAARIGVYVCHCGTNIAGTVDVKALADYAAGLPKVVVSREYKYMCSDPGQALIEQDIAEHEPEPGGGGFLFAFAARGHVPARSGACWPESLLLPDGQHSRARFLGSYRQAEGHGKSQRPGARRGPARGLAQAACRKGEFRSIPACWSSAAASPASMRR